MKTAGGSTTRESRTWSWAAPAPLEDPGGCSRCDVKHKIFHYAHFHVLDDGHLKVNVRDKDWTGATVAIWASDTAGHPGAYYTMQDDGNFVIYSKSGEALWATDTGGNPGADWQMQDDGNFVIYSKSGEALWATDTGGNPGADWQMQDDGNFVIYSKPKTGETLWATDTAGHPGAYYTMQDDGNFVIYSKTGEALWASGTSGHAGAELVMQADGNLVIYDSHIRDSFTISKTVPAATNASFEVSSDHTDYQTPIRFFCTTEGEHHTTPAGYDGPHNWDFGDGTHSSDENPIHTYPRPTGDSGIKTYTVNLWVYNGTAWLHAQKDVTVYEKGRLCASIDSINGMSWNTKLALFLRPKGEDLDENKYLQGIFTKEDYDDPVYDLIPGDWCITVRALGYESWEEDVTVPPGKQVYIYHNMQPLSLQKTTTIAIGSVPTGADITITKSYTVLTGTTPFYAMLCCSGEGGSCTFDYLIKNGDSQVHGTSDLWTDNLYSGCSPHDDGGPSEIFVHLPVATGDSDLGALDPLVLRQPSDQRVVESGRALIRISVRSRKAITYRWYAGETGDTSQPIYGATGSVYITPPLNNDKQYWVRVHAGPTFMDSRTASVEVVDHGPILDSITPSYAVPGSSITLWGSGFNPDDMGENRVFFDEQEAIVQNIETDKVNVKVPKSIADKNSVDTHIKVNGVWSNSMSLEVKQDDCDSSGFCFVGSLMPGR